ncbi:MAG: putative metal-binding motif-containing protein [Minicystis sp.]
MLSRLSGPASAGAAVLVAALVVPAAARAAEDKVISGDQTLGGDYVFDNFTVTGTGKLHVPHLAADMTGGWLRVKANTITILDGGLIEADGAGHVGQDGADGQAPASTAGGGGKGATPGLPGGGGGFFAKGGNGTSEAVAGTCMDYGGAAPGGQSFFDMVAKTAMLGAAGGAANVMPVIATAGGSGGGGIVLQAAVIKLDGIVRANGSKPFAAGGVAPGGGSGGTVHLYAALLQGGGKVEAKGGDGAHGAGSTNPTNPITPNNGGGGSGGVILLTLPGAAMAPSSLTLTVTGGQIGDCNTTAPNGGVVTADLGAACVDLDGDGFMSSQCGGDDCDDAEPAIHPGATEACDGKDNDCNMQVDDGDALCAPGNACVDGTCKATTPDGGTPDAGPTTDAGAPPDHVEFGGGCAVPASGGLAEGAAAAAVFALGTLALAASRRPRGRRRR